MGEICKDPRNEAQAPTAGTIEGSRAIMAFLIRSEGAARTVRVMQYALEDLSREAEQPQNGADKDKAARYLRAAESLENPYDEIKDVLKI